MEVPTSHDRPPIAAAVIVDDGRVLLVRRRVAEGRLSWQFPAGNVEPRETGGDAAVRETLEETGLRVRAVGDLGGRVHPDTGRTMLYIACEVLGGTAHVASKEEVAEVTWCDRTTLSTYVPYPLSGPVQGYLDDSLTDGGRSASKGAGGSDPPRLDGHPRRMRTAFRVPGRDWMGT